MIGFFLSALGMSVFFIVKPTWDVYRRRVAFVNSLGKPEEVQAEAKAKTGFYNCNLSLHSLSLSAGRL